MRALSARQFVHVEARRRTAEASEVEGVKQLVHGRDRLDRIARADPGEQREQRQRLDPGLAEGIATERAEPLR